MTDPLVVISMHEHLVDVTDPVVRDVPATLQPVRTKKRLLQTGVEVATSLRHFGHSSVSSNESLRQLKVVSPLYSLA